MTDELYSERNPYEERDLFAMLERMRRQDELDSQMDRELGELIIATTKYAITCGKRKGMRFYGDDVLSKCTVYALEASRKAETTDPYKYVNYIVTAVQMNWKRDSITDANRKKLLFPVGDEAGVELAADIYGTPEGIAPWEALRIFTIKNKEAEYGQGETSRGCSGRNGEGAEPEQDGGESGGDSC